MDDIELDLLLAKTTSLSSSSTSDCQTDSSNDNQTQTTKEQDQDHLKDDESSSPKPKPRKSQRLGGKNFGSNQKSESKLFKEIGLLSLIPTDKTHPLYEPKSFKDMQKSEFLNEWQKAADEEYESLMKMGTWSLVTRLKNSPVVKSK